MKQKTINLIITRQWAKDIIIIIIIIIITCFYKSKKKFL